MMGIEQQEISGRGAWSRESRRTRDLVKIFQIIFNIVLPEKRH